MLKDPSKKYRPFPPIDLPNRQWPGRVITPEIASAMTGLLSSVIQNPRGTGPRLAPNPMPYENFAAQLRKPANTMPPYTPLVVSDAQLADIYAYVSGLPGPAKPEDVKILH